MCRRRNVAESSFGDADIGENFGDTTEGAILVAAAKADIDLAAEARTPRVGAFPFDPGRKLMTTAHRASDGFEAHMKGSPQAVPGRRPSRNPSQSRGPDRRLNRPREALQRELPAHSFPGTGRAYGHVRLFLAGRSFDVTAVRTVTMTG